MEGVATRQSADIVIIIDGVDAYRASVPRVWELFCGDGGLDTLFIFLVLLLGSDLL
jgi:hypothetical protein